MRLRLRQRDRSVLPAFCLAVAAMVCGCQFDGTSLLEKHLTPNRQAQAKQHWDAVRGGIQLQLAENHFKAGRLADAEKALEQAINLDPGSSKAHLMAAKLHLERGDLAKAQAAVEQAMALSDAGAETRYVAGIIAERYGDWETAAEHYAAAAAQAPQVAEYVLAQAELLLVLDKTIEALELIESRLDDFDGNAAMRILAAHLNQSLGLRGPAADYAREALRIAEDDQELVAETGRILVWAQRYEEAVSVLRPAVEKALSAKTPAPGSPAPQLADSLAPSVLHDLARAYMAMEQYHEARWALRVVMAHDEKDAAAWCLYAQASLMSGDLDGAAEALRSLHAAVAPTAESLLLAAEVALKRGAYSEAFDAASQAVRTSPRPAAAYCLLGQACEGLGRDVDAARAYVTAHALDPESPVAGALLRSLEARTRAEIDLDKCRPSVGATEVRHEVAAGFPQGGQP